MKRLSKLQGRALKFARDFCRATAPGRAGARALSTGSRLRACLRSGGEGQSLVEFALVLPVLAMLLTGVFWVGINICNYMALNNAVELGARYLKIEGNTSGNIATDLADPCLSVFQQMMGASSSLNADNITVAYKLNGSTIETLKGSANTCPSESDNFSAGGTFQIVATYPCIAGVYGVNLSACKLVVSSVPQTMTPN